MIKHESGDRLAELLLPYRRKFEISDDIDRRKAWYFTDAPPGVVLEALAIVDQVPDDRPNDRPTDQWLVAHPAPHGSKPAPHAFEPFPPDHTRHRL